MMTRDVSRAVTTQLLPLRTHQAHFVADQSRFIHLVGARQSGRTYASVAKVAEYALTYHNAQVLYAVPVADLLPHAAALMEQAVHLYLAASTFGITTYRYGHETRLSNGSVVHLLLLGGDPITHPIMNMRFDAICVDDYDHCHPDAVRIGQTRLRHHTHPPQMWITRRLRPTDYPGFSPAPIPLHPSLEWQRYLPGGIV